MTDPTPDWTSFKKRIRINAPAEKVYDAWSVPELLTSWFLEKADYTSSSGIKREGKDRIKKGDLHTWKWHNWNFAEKGKVLEANGKDRISFTFGSGGEVHVDLRSKEGETEIILTQESIPTDDKSKMNLFVGCSTGWTFWLTNLKAWLEYGITLHATGLSQNETDDLVNS